MDTNTRLSSFSDSTLIASGPLESTLRKTKAFLDNGGNQPVLIFDEASGEQVDFNFQGSAEEVIARVISPVQRKGPGRPRLGVVSREISLLPRHWEWLDSQPQSASATIRRLVEAARKTNPAGGLTQRRIEAAGRFMWAIAGDFNNFEEASRALYARDWDRLRDLVAEWPSDVRDHLLDLVRRVDAPAPQTL
ncbi:MAG TPA: DUF2239 family protein [Spirochaetia bacterium]|nr:DUF2239 family protein [Spirochaetia bacterium]